MASKNTTPSQLHDSVTGKNTIVTADGSTYKTLLLITAADNSKETHLYSIHIISDDTVARTLRFAINDGATDVEQCDITIPSLSGFDVNTPPVQAIANRSSPIFSRIVKDIRGNWLMPLAPGEILKVKTLVNVTATKTISVSLFGWNFTRS